MRTFNQWKVNQDICLEDYGMLKGVLCILVIGICGYIGSLFSKKYALRQAEIADMLNSLSGIKNRILRREIVSFAVRKEAKGPIGPHLLCIADKVGENPKESLGSVWADEFSRCEEKAFINIGNAIEGFAKTGNSTQLDEIIFELTNTLHTLNLEKKGKMQGYMSVGILLGVFLGVIFI